MTTTPSYEELCRIWVNPETKRTELRRVYDAGLAAGRAEREGVVSCLVGQRDSEAEDVDMLRAKLHAAEQKLAARDADARYFAQQLEAVQMALCPSHERGGGYDATRLAPAVRHLQGKLAALVDGLRAMCGRGERKCTPCAVAHQVRRVASAVYWKGEVSLTVCAECLAHEIATGNVDLYEPVKHPPHVAEIRALIQSAGPCAPPSSGTE